MSWIQQLLVQLPPPAVYGAVAAVVLAESVLLLSAFAPSLTTLLISGFLARTGTVQLPLVIATAVAAVLVGDLLAQRTGRALGPRLGTGAVGRRIPRGMLTRTYRLLARRGGAAVFLCRFMPVVRTLAPHLAGAAGLRFRRIAPYSLAAGALWATAESMTGYAVGASYTRLTSVGPLLGAGAAVLLAAAALVLRRRSLREQRGAADVVVTLPVEEVEVRELVIGP
ncbi:DedA family protein [Streptacidiphilus carbonis]|uniref:DedA family protein n=1 Tax=Streptacidiphilus carbonis TaxID=105422 RepID=UPI0007C7041B|nr:DedA family protein [Streptacidiphilus carbonis]